MDRLKCQRFKIPLTVVTLVLMITAIIYLHIDTTSYQHFMPAFASPKSSQQMDVPVQSYPCPSLSGVSKLTVCPGDVIPEETALSFPSCVDEKLAADAGKSVVSLPGGRLRYKQGEIISIFITLHDGNGRRKTVGGDHLRARIVGDGGKSIVTGTISDHDNGSYTAQFEALFSGKLTTDGVLAYTRETITSNYRTRTKIMGTRNIVAGFVNKDTSEETHCHTFPYWLANYTELCNFTMENSGMPWYCGKPVHRNLLCADWVNIRTGNPYPAFPITPAEKKLLTRQMKSIPIHFNITVDAITPNPLATRSSLVPCKHYNITDLWNKREPTGFIHKGQWFLRHCQAKSLPDFKTCVRNRTILLFGDSTTRQWFEDFMSRFDCKITSEPWGRAKWHKGSTCVNKDLKLTVEWLPHSQPFYVGSDIARYTTLSVSRYIDENIKDEDRVIVLLHMHMHVVPNHHEVFQTKNRIISQSVKRLLARNKHVTVLIKASHTYRQTPAGGERLPDYFGYLYRNILFHEFAGLHDKVVYLDHKDITNALQLVPNHPPKDVVSAMVDQMFSYIC